jgi:hypothetical protein
VTADHDLLDIRHPDGHSLTPRELQVLIVELIEYGTGVQHPATLYWRPSDQGDVARRDEIIASHMPGREPVLRFAPGRPGTVVDASTPVGRSLVASR